MDYHSGMSLVEKLALMLLPEGRGVISITGAGGKTSTLKALGAHFRSLGCSVLLTTTTKIQSPKTFDYDVDHAFTQEADALAHDVASGESVFYAQRALMDPKKLVSPREEVLSALIPRYDVVIIEADGAKNLPLKFHSERDPVIPDQTDATLAIMGLSAWGDRVDNSCFGFESDALVDSAFLNFLIASSEGALKRAKGRTVLFLNQADVHTASLEDLKCPVPIVMGSLREDCVYGSL